MDGIRSLRIAVVSTVFMDFNPKSPKKLQESSAIQQNHAKSGENGNGWIPWKTRKKYGFMYGKARPFYAKPRPLYVYGWGTYEINILYVFCAYLVRMLLYV